ncbi:TssQ family T6SS-associated lipoprotein [uncultured Aquabacterium sp.]|mgnify:CR=1 FL=1|uniref:TssQ family T6SS-associated lipoprotein n=1 Tax=Aquabacterium sp. TaxID=1872578 RepID=UPI0025FF0AB0|nr:TssQ family T6SS-associated lipoprotein [uncultured Aquabacterium sp.]
MKSVRSRPSRAVPSALWSRVSGRSLLLGPVVLMLAACQNAPTRPAVDPGPPPSVRPAAPAAAPAGPASPPAVVQPTTPPAEQTLAQGVRSYQGGKYAMAEVQLRQALKDGLASGVDRANAHKHLAFIYCTSQREKQCLEAFRAARAADPAFALSKTESGHPMWARAYQRAMADARTTSTPRRARTK